MSDKLISLESVLKEIRRFKGYIDDDMIERFSIAFKRLPAIPQEMTASEFLKEFERMCKINGGSTIFKCSTECPIFNKVKGYLLKCKPWVVHHPEEAIAIVEKFAQEHPKEVTDG